MNASSRPAVVVLNLAHTGLGIIRNLHPWRVPVVGVTADPKMFGNHTRLAEVVFGPDSMSAPDELLDFLCRLAQRFPSKPVLFVTRDHDVLLVERFRDVLHKHFLLPIPMPGVLEQIVDKWKMVQIADRVGLKVPRTYHISSWEQLEKLASQLPYPCVVKPVSSFHWRGGQRWERVGRRKAFRVDSPAPLLAEYRTLAEAHPEVLIQEEIPGPDDNFFVFGGYFDRNSRLRGGFGARKILQYPPTFGTGCLVESAQAPAIRDYSVLLLQGLRYHGIAEVEFKQDARDGSFKFIEVNPRHWDWHRLGTACGVNLSALAYWDLTGQEPPEQNRQVQGPVKWVAEDAFSNLVFQALRDKQIRWGQFVSYLRGRKTYGIFSINDPLPFFYFLFRSWLPQLTRKILHFVFSRVLKSGGKGIQRSKGIA